jgi:alpha-galactosidase
VAHGAHQHPGAWNDPDYLQMGWIGDGRSAKLAHLAAFTPDEQYSYMALWSLMASPLFYSGDLTRMDAFTLNVLCNPEVIAVDQDPLGKCGHLAAPAGKTFVLIKELADGGRAVGLFNRGAQPATVAVNAQDLGWTGPAAVRDLWREKDLGSFGGTYSAEVPARGVVLISVEPR